MSWKCAICFSLLEENKDCSCTPCGHVFHSECLTRWFSSNGGSNTHTCPECRTPVDNPIKLYPTVHQSLNKEKITKEFNRLQEQLELIHFTIKHDEAVFSCAKSGVEKQMVKAHLDISKALHSENELMKDQEVELESQSAAYQQERIKYLREKMMDIDSALDRASADRKFHSNAYSMIYGEQQDVEKVFQDIQDDVCSGNSAEIQDSVKELVNYCLILKHELCVTVAANSNLKEELKSFTTRFLEFYKEFF